MLLAGLAYGSIGDDVASVLGSSDATQELFVPSGTDLVNGFYGTSIVMLAVICCGFAISSALRPHAEEENGHVEVLLSTSLSRRRWLAGHVAVTLLGSLLVLACAGIGLGGGYLLVTGDGSTAWSLTWPILSYAGPVLVLSGVARLLFGLRPRWLALAWVPLVFVAVVMLFGDLFRIPQWLQDVSPFEVVALVPAERFTWAPVLLAGAVAALLSVAGQFAFLRRDVH
jgi:ABC-2 type transport system permease protein